ncbi:U6 snRNA-associated Sm-like protein LSm1, putative [Plasmodium knowlesi strain H]|uniref:U6 snRNA-associated Sm-like protein LSm1, putative n=1 Tax=Plasmodium knowlesi (strain H) TaxID=5851 RepID=A0A1A7VEG8_PLAKH|nr:U6 snRNA-associated Sm-like protein LSm1, putative [Plasmodium knowlesi strain H]
MEQSSMPLWLSTFEEDIDTYIFISSRDNKLYQGILRTYDQHGNIFLTHCVEKIIIPERNYFSDIYMFDYSQENKATKEAEDNSEADLVKNQKSLSSENVVLQYKPINQILSYLPDNNQDYAAFDN